jgi:ABC-2 type transport system ATP-binding protein
MESVIRIGSLTKRYRGLTAVDSLDFEVARGRIVAFLGPNGAGKTTTLRVLLGLAPPTSGGATVNDRRYADLESPVETVGAVLDRPQFHPDRSGRDHLRVLAAAAELPKRRVDEVLDLVELSEAGHRRVRGYSLGMRQRLSIAGALLGRPRALVLDEPANGLDPRGHRWLHDLLRAERDRGAAILISSHHIPEVQPLADEVVIIHRGKGVAQGAISDLTGGPTIAVRVHCSNPQLLRDALTQHGIDAELESTGAVVARDVAATRVGELALRRGIAIHQMDADERTLEDVFLQLTASGAQS